jgi:hypothetical protein
LINLLFALWLSAIGVVATAPALNWLTPIGMGSIAPAIGVALYLITGALLAALDSFSVVSALSASTVVALIGSMVIFRSYSLRFRPRPLVAGALIAASLTALVSVVALNLHTTRFTTDSFGYLMSASALDQTGGLDGIDNLRLVKQQAAVPLIQAIGWASGTVYSPVLSPLFGATTLAAIGWLATRSMRRDKVKMTWQIGLLASAGALLMTTNRFVFNLTYINGHMLLAMMLLVGVGLVWLGVVEGEHRFFYVSSLAFAAAAITRAESLIVVALFLIPFLSTQQLALRDRLVVTMPVSILAFTWFGVVLPPHAREAGLSLSHLIGNVAIAALLAVFASIAGVRGLRRFVPLVPWLAVAGTLLILAIYVQSDPSLFLTSVNAMAANAAFWGFWGFFWFIVPTLLIAAILSSNVDEDHLWTFGLSGFFLFIPVAGYLRGSAFRIGGGDSANRMLLHIVPMVILFILVAAGRATTQAEAQGDDDATESV